MNLHHQHQYSEDRESEKMDEIEKNKLREANKGLFEHIQNTLEQIDRNYVKIAELKKADEVEVKPVFPRVNYFMVNPGTDEAADLGLTSDTESGICEIKDQLHAKAYIIEEINRVNKGDNGFGEERFLLAWHHDENELGFIGERLRQHCEPGMYINSSLDANSLSFREDIINAYKIIFGIE